MLIVQSEIQNITLDILNQYGSNKIFLTIIPRNFSINTYFAIEFEPKYKKMPFQYNHD